MERHRLPELYAFCRDRQAECQMWMLSETSVWPITERMFVFGRHRWRHQLSVDSVSSSSNNFQKSSCSMPPVSWMRSRAASSKR